MSLRPLSAVIFVCGSFAFAHAADPVPVTNQFKLKFAAEMTMEGGGRTDIISGGAGFQYTWKRAGKERTLILSEMSLKTTVGDQDFSDVKMSRAGMFGIRNGKKVDLKYDELPEPAQKKLRDTFDTPLCKLEVDERGKEVKRTILAGKGAQIVIETGVITNTMLLHPPYYTDRDEWEVEGVINDSQGDAKGKLTYKKVAGGKGRQLVKVSGVLNADGMKVNGMATIKDSKYVVTGTQTYDPDLKEWVEGKFDIDVTFAGVDDEKVVLNAKGKMKLTLELVAEKK